jgi:hypothetical protein
VQRSFTFTITVTDSQGNLVTEASGETHITGTKTTDQICRAITSDLPAHLRRPDYRHTIQLRQL